MEGILADYILNHFELSQYGLLRSQIKNLDNSIEETEEELAELNKYNMNISPVLTGMPSGNEKRDKIADYLVKLEADRLRLNAALTLLVAERDVTWHYFDGLSIGDVAEKSFSSASSVYRKINKYLKLEMQKKS